MFLSTVSLELQSKQCLTTRVNTEKELYFLAAQMNMFSRHNYFINFAVLQGFIAFICRKIWHPSVFHTPN